MRQRLKQSCIWTVAVILISTCTYIRAQPEKAKISTFGLGRYGWQPLPERHPGQGGEWLGIYSRRVSIDHKGRVLVGYVALDNQGLAKRERPSLSFHILRFTPEGKLDLSLILPTNDYFTNGFYLGASDEILARANDMLQVLREGDEASDAGEVWQALVSCPENCSLTQSFSRRTMILRTSVGTDHSTYTVLDISSSPPRVEQTCPRMAFYGQRITDKFAYWPGSEGVRPFIRRYSFCDVDHPLGLSLQVGGVVFALNDETFLSLGGEFNSSRRGGVKVVRSDGRVLFRHDLPDHEIPLHHGAGWVTADDRGDRFAFIVDTLRGGSRFFDVSRTLTDARVLVYSQAGLELASVPVNAATSNRDFDFSLSPDGLRLAILDKDVVTVVDLNKESTSYP